MGGGDTAMEDATFLAKFAGKVSIVHRRDEFRASAIMLDRAKAMENIELVTPYVVERFEPGENGLSRRPLENTEDGSHKEIPVTGAFVAIGHRPNSQLVADQLPVDDEGYLLVEGRSTKTRLPGVFAAGDLTDRVYRQRLRRRARLHGGTRRRGLPARHADRPGGPLALIRIAWRRRAKQWRSPRRPPRSPRRARRAECPGARALDQLARAQLRASAHRAARLGGGGGPRRRGRRG